MIYFSLASGLILIVFLSFAIYWLWTKYMNTKVVKGFLVPGTVVHELSHALLCLVTGTTIKELNLFATTNTGIRYDRPKVPGVFDFFIASAPIFGCAFTILLIEKILSHPIDFTTSFPREIHFTFKGLFDFLRYLLDAVWDTFNACRNRLQIRNVRHSLFLLSVIIFTVSMAPHTHDIKYLVSGFVILAVILFFFEKFGFHLLEYPLWKQSVAVLWRITALTISVLSTLLFITLIIMGFVKGIKLTFGGKGARK